MEVATFPVPNFRRRGQFLESLECYVEIGTFVRIGYEDEDNDMIGRIIDFAAEEDAVQTVSINPYIPIEQCEYRHFPDIPVLRSERLPEVVQTDLLFEVPPELIQQFCFVFSLIEIATMGIVVNEADNIFLVRYRTDRGSVQGTHCAFPCEAQSSVTRSTSKRLFNDWERIRDRIDNILNRVTEKQGVISTSSQKTVIGDEVWAYICSMLHPTMQVVTRRSIRKRNGRRCKRMKFSLESDQEIIICRSKEDLKKFERCFGGSSTTGVRKTAPKLVEKPKELEKNDIMNVVVCKQIQQSTGMGPLIPNCGIVLRFCKDDVSYGIFHRTGRLIVPRITVLVLFPTFSRKSLIIFP